MNGGVIVLPSKRFHRREAVSKGFRSKFELDVSKWFEENKIKVSYEPCKVKYTVPESQHSYTPDFQIGTNESILIEAKGYFSAADRKKMIHVIRSNPNITFRMILQNSTMKISKRSKTSYADWCDKNGIEWVDWKDKTKLKRWCK